MVATGTFCPDATLGAPQIICTGISNPKSTVVIFKRSALGCCTHVKTSPITIPSRLPFIDSIVSTPSTSNPRSVSNSLVLLVSQLTCKNCFNQLYDIFI